MPERDTTLMDFMQLTDQPMPQSGDLVAQAGSPREDGSGQKPERAAIEAALREVYDPEIPVNIYDLGLIYEIFEGQDGTVELTMTLTAPGCPVAGILPQQVADAVASADGVGEVFVTLTWEPAWTMDKMSEDARMALGMF